TPSVPRPISFYALAGRDPEPNTTIRKEEATWSRTSSCRCGSEQFIQKENFPEFTYPLFVLWNRVIYTKLLTHPGSSFHKLLFCFIIEIIHFKHLVIFSHRIDNINLFFFDRKRYRHRVIYVERPKLICA